MINHLQGQSKDIKMTKVHKNHKNVILRSQNVNVRQKFARKKVMNGSVPFYCFPFSG